MESEISSEQELQQLKIISENQEKLLKKIEELEKNDNEEEKQLKNIQNNINNLFELINNSLKKGNKTNTNSNNNNNTTINIPLEINNTPTTENPIAPQNINSINTENSNDDNSNTITEILESRESNILYTEDEFKEFIGKIIEAPSSFYRQNMIETEVKKKYMFTIEQIGELLNLLPYMSEKKATLKILKNSIHDYYQKQELMKYLKEETEEQKQEIYNILFN